MKAALQLHPSKVTRRYLEELVYPALLANGVKHYLLPKRHDGDVELEKGTDFLIVIGGDGTFLSGAKVAVQYGVPVVGVMTGRLGFLCNVSIEEFPDVVKRIAEGKVPVETRSILEGTVHSSGEEDETHLAVNDVVVYRTGSHRIREFVATDNDKLVARYRGDGIIISSSTGSTAYTLAAGGPLLHPQLDAIVLSPICAHSLFTKPLVLPPDNRVTIRGARGSYPLMVSFDGGHRVKLNSGDSISVVSYSQRLLVYKPHDEDFYEVLREKFQHGYLYGGEDAEKDQH
ncbi:MAG: NAD(+)/NADH kinase [Planctomycetales bacterium]|nr:NAD(+)/NADH kinase [bacterium]UNM07418.1 MAG: NAD(+)/NADH kinase [Planctomycetales bacterium]